MGVVQHLFIKQQRKNSMSASSEVYLLQGFGIEGDINSDRTSPRQVLIVNGQDLTQLSIPPGELRENIILNQIDSSAFKPGAKISFSSGAQIRLTFYCEPCKRISHLVTSLNKIQHKRGILGVVIKEGQVKTGDRIIIEPNAFPALSEIPYERFLQLVNKIPFGKVITYKQILQSIGVDRSYYRVMPVYLKKSSTDYPIHRIVDSKGHTISHIPNHREQLEAEGIKVSTQAHVSLEDYAWQNPLIF